MWNLIAAVRFETKQRHWPKRKLALFPITAFDSRIGRNSSMDFRLTPVYYHRKYKKSPEAFASGLFVQIV